MKWEIKQKELTNGWEKWFAWKPTRIGNKLIWLEFIYRKGRWIPLSPKKNKWDYKESIFDVLKEKSLGDIAKNSNSETDQAPAGSSFSGH